MISGVSKEIVWSWELVWWIWIKFNGKDFRRLLGTNNNNISITPEMLEYTEEEK